MLSISSGMTFLTDETNFLRVTICLEVTTFLEVIASLARVFYTTGVSIEAANTGDTYTGSSCLGATSIGGTGGAFITSACIGVAGVGNGCIGDAHIIDVAVVQDACFKDAGAIRDTWFRDTGAVRDTRFRDADTGRNACFRDVGAVNCLEMHSQSSQILELN